MVDCVSNKVNYIDITLPICINPGEQIPETDRYQNVETSVSKTFPPPFPNYDQNLNTYWLFPYGKGDGTFGKDIDTYHVLKWKIMQNPPFYFSVKIKNQQVGAIQQAMWLRTGIGQRSGVILGPTCPFLAQTLSYAPATNLVKIKLGQGDICVGKDPATGCINDVLECDLSYHYPITPIQSVVVDGSALQWAGGEGQGQCPTVILVTQSSPLCYTIGSGGNATKICYCKTNADCLSVGKTTCSSGKCR
jgi:hypothetical protein